MKSIFLLVFILFSHLSFGQVQFRDSLYSTIDVSTHKYHPIKDSTLEFDYYHPIDSIGPMPLIIYVHGGGFSAGTRDHDGIVTFAKRMASRGYAVVSVSYRLTMKGIGFGCDITPDQKKQAINHASYDVMMATKHILNYENIYNIKRDKVILMGSSAGAEAVLHLAYGYNYKPTLGNFRFAGVISMAGVLTSIDFITQTNAIPTQMFHGTGDPFLPYQTGPHHYCGTQEVGFLMNYGSAPISERLKGMGGSYYLYSIKGGSHRWSGLPISRCYTEIVDFLYNDVLFSKGNRQTERTIVDY